MATSTIPAGAAVSTKNNPKPAAQTLLEPSTPYDVAALMVMQGMVDAGVFCDWCKRDATAPLDGKALETFMELIKADGVPFGMSDLSAIIDGQKNRAAKRKASDYSISASGRVVCSKAKIGKQDFYTTPKELLDVLDSLPGMIAFTIEHANDKQTKETSAIVNPAYLKAKQEGKTGDELKAIPYWSKVDHKRLGLSAIDWSGTDQAAAIKRLQGFLAKLNG